jgi:hypothetical protein
MRRLVALLLLTAAGCESSTLPCTVDVQVAIDVSGKAITPCGNFKLGPTSPGFDADFVTAQRCVLDAVAAKQPFALVYDVPADNKHERVGLSGQLAGSDLVVRQYAYSAGADEAHPRLSRQVCTPSMQTAAVTATPDCTPTVGHPCLTCNAPQSGMLVCSP